MSGHPCGSCLRWWECNGVAWNTPDCPYSTRTLTTCGPVREALEAAARNPDPDPLPPWPKKKPEKAVPAYLDDKIESGLLEEE